MSTRSTPQKRGRWGAGGLHFKWQGWSKDIYGFEIFNSRIVLGRKIWQFFGGQLDLSRDFFGYSKHPKFVVVPAFPGCKHKHSEHAYDACTLCSWCLDLWWMDRFHSFFVIVVCSTVNSSNLTISNVSCSLEGIYICSPVNNISNAENGTTSVNVTGKRSKSFKKTGLYVYASDRVHMYTVNLKT